MTAPPSSPLLCHATAACVAVERLIASAYFDESGQLALFYRLYGHPDGLQLPAPQAAAAADGLWQHTCCEAFVAAVDGREYREFNFSPSRQWAAYAFSDYRQRDPAFVAPLSAPAPQIHLVRLPDGFELQARLDQRWLPLGDRWQVSLTAVIEAADGSKTYWALQHAAAQPDFHLRQSFVLTLAADCL